MSIELLKKLPTPTEIKADYPVTQKVARIKEERDEMIRKVFTGESDKFLVIIGPCSADNEEAVCEYINRLSRVQEEVADKLILIPRIYTNKPRTTGEGYKGILHQPDPEKTMRQDLPVPMRCCTRKPGDIWMIFSLMLRSVRVPWKISSIVW